MILRALAIASVLTLAGSLASAQQTSTNTSEAAAVRPSVATWCNLSYVALWAKMTNLG